MPALILSQCAGALTLVVTPTISLMEDQVANLPMGMTGMCWHSHTHVRDTENS